MQELWEGTIVYCIDFLVNDQVLEALLPSRLFLKLDSVDKLSFESHSSSSSLVLTKTNVNLERLSRAYLLGDYMPLPGTEKNFMPESEKPLPN
jgi:hypothetical protein